jgi:hypothetical protein
MAAGDPVPAIAAGSWAAAGNTFFVNLRRPRAPRIERFSGVRRVQIGNNGIAAGTIAADGTATVPLRPQGYGTRWYPNQISVATASGANDVSTTSFYLNVIGPGGFLGQSYAGGGDQPGFGVPEMQPGDTLYAVWSGGKPGDWCQVAVIGPMDIAVTS